MTSPSNMYKWHSVKSIISFVRMSVIWLYTIMHLPKIKKLWWGTNPSRTTHQHRFLAEAIDGYDGCKKEYHVQMYLGKEEKCTSYWRNKATWYQTPQNPSTDILMWLMLRFGVIWLLCSNCIHFMRSFWFCYGICWFGIDALLEFRLERDRHEHLGSTSEFGGENGCLVWAIHHPK